MQNYVNIISVAPYAVAAANRPFGTYLVPAAPKGGYTKYKVKDAVDWFSVGHGKYTPNAIQATALAEDLIKDVRDHGVGIIEDDEPSEAFLKELREAQAAYMTRVIDEADADYRQHGNRSLISAHAKAFADMLGLKREWTAAPLDLISCPNCEQRVSPMVAQCPNCRATIDYVKAREFGLLTPEQEKNAILMGKLQPLLTDTETPAKKETQNTKKG